MATSPEMADYILDQLKDRQTFSVRRMFGEYCLYADGKPVGFICDDRLFVKIVPASRELEGVCEKGPAYPGSKDYYMVDEGQLSSPRLLVILQGIAAAIPMKKTKS